MEQTRTSAPFNPNIENAAQQVHQTVDKVADKAVTGVDRASDLMHRAVNAGTDKAAVAADWATQVPEQVKRAGGALTESACSSIRSRPLTTVFGALAIGYVLGRIARW